MNNAQSAIRSARLNLDQLPVLSGNDFEDWAGSYGELQPVIVKALTSAHGKVCLLPPLFFSFFFLYIYITTSKLGWTMVNW